MVNSLMAKLNRCLMESKGSAWSETKMERELMVKVAFENMITPLFTLSPFKY